MVGGSGRVGGSTVRWIHELSRRGGAVGLTPLTLAIGGQSASSFAAAQRRLSSHGVPATELQFVPMDVEAPVGELRSIVRGRAIVVNTAGPFQVRSDPAPLVCGHPKEPVRADAGRL